MWLSAAALCGIGGLIGLYAIVRWLGWGTAPRLRPGLLWACIALGVASLSVPAYVTLSGAGDPLMFALLVSVPLACLAHLLFMA